jgi:hypothetical protein
MVTACGPSARWLSSSLRWVAVAPGCSTIRAATTYPPVSRAMRPHPRPWKTAPLHLRKASPFRPQKTSVQPPPPPPPRKKTSPPRRPWKTSPSRSEVAASRRAAVAATPAEGAIGGSDTQACGGQGELCQTCDQLCVDGICLNLAFPTSATCDDTICPMGCCVGDPCVQGTQDIACGSGGVGCRALSLARDRDSRSVIFS